MEKSISIKTLLLYKRGELTPKKNQEVESFLLENPHYEKILSGLQKLKDTLGEDNDEEILKFLSQKKAAIKEKIFGKKGKKDPSKDQ